MRENKSLGATMVAAAILMATTATVGAHVRSDGDGEYFCSVARQSAEAFPDFVNRQFEIDPVLARSAAEINAPFNGQEAMIPLPPGAWTGLAGLASLALLGCRKSMLRFLK